MSVAAPEHLVRELRDLATRFYAYYLEHDDQESAEGWAETAYALTWPWGPPDEGLPSALD